MHCYLFVECKTAGCKTVTYIAHKEWPTDDYAVIDYPDEYFPLNVACPRCRQAHSYQGKEVRTRTSQIPLHSGAFVGLPSDPRGPSSDTN